MDTNVNITLKSEGSRLKINNKFRHNQFHRNLLLPYIYYSSINVHWYSTHVVIET